MSHSSFHPMRLLPSNEEPEELIRYAAPIHNSVMTSTEQWETSCLVNDAFGTTSWLFQDVSDITFIVFTELCVSATFCVSFHSSSSLPLNNLQFILPLWLLITSQCNYLILEINLFDFALGISKLRWTHQVFVVWTRLYLDASFGFTKEGIGMYAQLLLYNLLITS
jgi:hypothetical protein